MKKSILLLLFCVLQVFLFADNETGRSTEPVIISITIDGGISPFVADHVTSAITHATKQDAAALLINLDTPGGLYDTTREIVQALLASPVPVFVYVSPAGARAGSAGVFIALASHILAMAPSTNIGAAQPVSISGQDVEGDMKKKITNDAKAWARSIAETRKRNADWAEQSVVGAESITAQKALKLGVINFIAKDVAELLEKAHGTEVLVANEKIIVRSKNAKIVSFPMSPQQKLMKFFANPNLIYILMLLGLLGVFIEFQSPGLIFPGLVGVLCLAVVFGVQVLPINWFGALLILAAAAFFIAEIFVTSFGVLGIAGLLLLVVGSYLLFDVDGSGFSVDPLVIWLVSGGFAAILLGVGFLLLKARRQGATSNVDALVGQRGVVKKSIDPTQSGIVFLHGSHWRAQASEVLHEGDEVIVERVEGTTIFVTKGKGNI